jgi:predicted HTH domain antitoxin
MVDVMEDIDLLRDAGAFTSREAVIEEAVWALLETRPDLWTELAITKYTAGEVSLNRAAEFAGVSPEEFKDLLRSRGVDRDAGFLSAEDRTENLEQL